MMVEVIKRNRVFIWGILSFGIIYSILIAHMYPLHTPSEEVGALSGAALLAGYDWSNVVSSDCSYYGIGFYSICAPLFQILKNPIIIYRCIIGINAFIRLSIAIISYYIGKKYFKIENTLLLSIVSLITPLLQVSRISRGAHNDLVMDGLLWVVVLLICKLIYSKTKKESFLTVFSLAIVLLYGLTVHTRWLVVVLGAIIVAIWGCIIAHKRYVPVVAFLLLLGCLYPLSTKLIEGIKKSIWNTSGYLTNGQVRVSYKINYFSPDTWKLWADTILGNLSTWVIVSGGLASFIVIALISFFVYKIKKKENSEFDTCICIIASLVFICMAATLLGLLVSDWTAGMFEGYISGRYEGYSFKAMTYLRYWGVYASPLILCAIAVVEKYKIWRVINKSVFITNIIFVAVFFIRILPYIENNKNALMNSFIGISGMKYESKVSSSEYFIIAVIISLQMMFFFYVLISCNKTSVAMSMVLVLLTIQMISANWNYDIPQQKMFNQSINQIIEYYYNLEETELPRKLYVIEKNSKRDNNFKQSVLVQFYLFNRKVYSQIPDKFVKGDAIVSREEISDYILDEYSYEEIRLDDNEFWYWIQ